MYFVAYEKRFAETYFLRTENGAEFESSNLASIFTFGFEGRLRANIWGYLFQFELAYSYL